MQIKKTTKVAVGMSGGVDSSVSAALLKEQGYDVLGVFLHFWSESVSGKIRDNICCSLESQEDARRVCQKLKIPFYTLNMETPFKEKIVDDFIEQYKNCRTPNPCVRCNKYIKFNALREKMRPLCIDYIATGHYARIEKSGARFALLKGKDEQKDQTYFLHQATQEQLAHTLFPIGNYFKSEVRALAKKFGLATASKKESQEICFVADGETGEFLSRYIKFKKGKIADVSSGEVIGEHNGLPLYTIGQRKGIGLSGWPWYVAAADVQRNILLVSRDEIKIYSSAAVIDEVNWIASVEPVLPLKANCRIRSTAKEVGCLVRKNKIKSYCVDFVEEQRAVTVGQYCVFYDGDECLGGGVIV